MPNRAVHPRARSIFKARTKKPNFVLSVAATTIRLSFIIALCVGLALLGAVIGIAKAFVDAVMIRAASSFAGSTTALSTAPRTLSMSTDLSV